MYEQYLLQDSLPTTYNSDANMNMQVTADNVTLGETTVRKQILFSSILFSLTYLQYNYLFAFALCIMTG